MFVTGLKQGYVEFQTGTSPSMSEIVFLFRVRREGRVRSR